MVALKIEEQKAFTAGLFIGEIFDKFLVREAEIVTYNQFTIDGKVRQGYFSKEELEENRIEEYSSWKTLKPVCYSLIKGKLASGELPHCISDAPIRQRPVRCRKNPGNLSGSGRRALHQYPV